MEKEIVAALIGVAGSGLIGLAIYLGDRARTRAVATMDMLREFHSMEMSEARGSARRFVQAYPELNFDLMHELKLDEAGEVDRKNLFVIARFFVRLKELNDNNMLRKRKIAALFGPMLGYWYGLCFEKQLVPSTWLIRHDIEALKRWVEARAGKRWPLSKPDPAVWQEWYQFGKNDRPAPAPKQAAPPGPQGGQG